ncbi:MAG: hypothetical protein Q8L79_16305 [Methylobacter sp.]|uniref:hypothetical protein n=1 Tax=Methylobacter sp. TaxID=2051955 RepID=UPI0027317776|nr:hypothetical protein [Methylobacter sp.]MDP1666674.1 hypothetical protein [Methylobacter sp.]MDP1969705.1 hypothetical protein [Methylobacter sp.]
MKAFLKRSKQSFFHFKTFKNIVINVFGAGILLLFLLPLSANAALRWDWHYSGDDNSVQQGTFVTTDGNIFDPNTIYTVTEFSVTRSDAGHLSVGAPIGSTTDGTYQVFENVPLKFRVVNNEFIFAPPGVLGGRYDTVYDSPNGWHTFLFTNIPDQSLASAGYLYYNPPEGPQQCCNNGRVFTSGPSFIAFTATPNVLWPPNNKLVPVTVSPIEADLLSCQITSVNSNELITTEDYQITGALTVDLRAKRLGKGGGRVYTINVSCLLSGSEVTGNVTVTVPHDQGR